MSSSAMAPGGSPQASVAGLSRSLHTRSRTVAAGASPAAGVPVKAAATYEIDINPKLRMLYETEEYRSVLDILSKLRIAKQLEEFFARSVRYWKDADVADFTSQDAEFNRKTVQKVKRDWPSIWPEAMESDRLRSYDAFGKLWKRLDSSRVLDLVIEEVVPDLEQNTEENSRLFSLSPEDQIDEILYRLERSKTAQQLAILAKDDNEALSLAPRVGRWAAQILLILQEKSFEPTERTPFAINAGFFAVLFLILVGSVSASGLLGNFFGGESSAPPDAVTYVEPWRMALEDTRKAEGGQTMADQVPQQ